MLTFKNGGRKKVPNQNIIEGRNKRRDNWMMILSPLQEGEEAKDHIVRLLQLMTKDSLLIFLKETTLTKNQGGYQY